jgi:hypothetical protein
MSRLVSRGSSVRSPGYGAGPRGSLSVSVRLASASFSSNWRSRLGASIAAVAAPLGLLRASETFTRLSPRDFEDGPGETIAE